MNTLKLLLYVPAIALVLAAPARANEVPRLVQKSPAPDQPRISGPDTHENLTVFAVHGRDALKGRTFLTLGEALEQKKVRVYETDNVNELAIENVSDEEIFVQAGDIVRGGKQDRVMAVDLIVEAHSGRVPIASFCVESGRWSPRGVEASLTFDSSSNSAPTNCLIDIQKNADQSKVWARVAVTQRNLASNLNADVTDADSESSLELTLETVKVQQTVSAYTAKLLPALKAKDDVIGFVVATNGKLSSAEVYASPNLFRRLCPKLLESAAVTAIASLHGERASKPTTASDVRAFLAAARDGKASTKEISPRVRMITRESSGYILFETFDTSDGICVHRRYIKKQ